MNLERIYRQAPASTLISAAIIIVYAGTAIQSRSLTNNLGSSSIGDAWILYAPAMNDGFGPLRALGGMFLHVGPGHMLLNLLLLWLLGREIERDFGSGLFALMYFVGGIGASAAVVWMDPFSPTAGASGAIYAMMAILVGLFLLRGADIKAPLILIAVNIGYTLMASNVSLWGHLGGLITGALLMWPVIRAKTQKTQWVISVAGLCLVSGVLFLGLSYS
ncbi:rhomboid family intramembrane serine protease [Corynebacterium crudilactis]|uniref:Rhomboid family intramembrane serine protease n=1 Tax=Corynebacterium crudilactis TaxID=1652495 RepID=A0A172QQ29_9CORY|nr:rhomboid family intramembrane serine protease [Corynebacterium crudilactis]ANE02796.1 rhomboid family intramembrane serine protease [Corynebacterium crudilactis]